MANWARSTTRPARSSPTTRPSCTLVTTGSRCCVEKGNLYHAGIRTPMIAVWPGGTRRGTRTKSMVQRIDILSTPVEAGGGANRSGIDGRSSGAHPTATGRCSTPRLPGTATSTSIQRALHERQRGSPSATCAPSSSSPRTSIEALPGRTDSAGLHRRMRPRPIGRRGRSSNGADGGLRRSSTSCETTVTSSKIWRGTRAIPRPFGTLRRLLDD